MSKENKKLKTTELKKKKKKNIEAERCRIPIMVSLSPRDLKVTARLYSKSK